MREGVSKREARRGGRQGQAGGEGETAVDLIKENGKMEGRGKGVGRRDTTGGVAETAAVYLSLKAEDKGRSTQRWIKLDVQST